VPSAHCFECTECWVHLSAQDLLCTECWVHSRPCAQRLSAECSRASCVVLLSSRFLFGNKIWQKLHVTSNGSLGARRRATPVASTSVQLWGIQSPACRFESICFDTNQGERVFVRICVYMQFQFQFFTLTLKNSDKTKRRGVDCDSIYIHVNVHTHICIHCRSLSETCCAHRYPSCWKSEMCKNEWCIYAKGCTYIFVYINTYVSTHICIHLSFTWRLKMHIHKYVCRYVCRYVYISRLYELSKRAL